MTGTTPPGAAGETQAAAWVQRMFAGIAPRYDLLNHLLSFNVDRAWRKLLVASLRPALERPGAKVLDLCCGTGDVMLALQNVSPALIMGADFCHPMLVAARQKASARHLRSPLFEADALSLPLADCSLDAIAISFGFRNLANYAAGLTELHRVLKPGGTLAILEFSHPPGAFMQAAYGLYSRLLLPVIGAAISGSREAYSYLPESIRRFPEAEQLQSMMRAAGFAHTNFRLLTGGVAALHIGVSAL